jgi:hypothetical protein
VVFISFPDQETSMEKIAVFVNDAAHAQHILQPMIDGGGPTHWIVVACPPTLTRHIGRWVSNSAREQWRERWAAELFGQLEPPLRSRAGSQVEKLLAKRRLIDVSARLEARFGPIRLLDARRPRVGKTDEPITATQPADAPHRWAAPMALTTGLSAVLALSD